MSKKHKKINKKDKKFSNPNPEYGDLMTMEDFILQCNEGLFIDYDGMGQYSDGKNIYPEMGYIYPSKINNLDKSFSHIVWYNR